MSSEVKQHKTMAFILLTEVRLRERDLFCAHVIWNQHTPITDQGTFSHPMVPRLERFLYTTAAFRNSELFLRYVNGCRYYLYNEVSTIHLYGAVFSEGVHIQSSVIIMQTLH